MFQFQKYHKKSTLGTKLYFSRQQTNKKTKKMLFFSKKSMILCVFALKSREKM